MKLAICEYINNCTIAEATNRKNCIDYENCQAYKFNKRYGDVILGVGAMCKGNPSIGLERKIEHEN